MLSPEERSLRARLAAAVRWARGGAKNTRRGREAREARIAFYAARARSGAEQEALEAQHVAEAACTLADRAAELAAKSADAGQ